MQIRTATKEDINQLITIEALCFPPAEAASAEHIKERFEAFGECFLVAEVEGEVIGFINGCVTNRPELPDALYHDVSLHNPKGAYQTVFGLDVLEAYRNQGIAGQLLQALIDKAKQQGRKGVVLTCKDYLVAYYERFGFVHQGISASEHGGSIWNDMVLTF